MHFRFVIFYGFKTKEARGCLTEEDNYSMQRLIVLKLTPKHQYIALCDLLIWWKLGGWK